MKVAVSSVHQQNLHVLDDPDLYKTVISGLNKSERVVIELPGGGTLDFLIDYRGKITLEITGRNINTCLSLS